MRREAGARIGSILGVIRTRRVRWPSLRAYSDLVDLHERFRPICAHEINEEPDLDAVALALNTMIEAKLKQRQTGTDGATPIE